MRIVIVGAGIAGLTAAAALARAGRACVLVDQAPYPDTIASGVRLGPNSTRLLTGIGLRRELAAASVRPEERDVRDGASGRLLHRTRLGAAAAERFGAPELTLLRPRLHALLREAVPRSAVQQGRYVTDILENSDEVEVRCSDGHVLHGDVVVAADGVHSLLRPLLRSAEARPLDLAVYRGVVPAPAVAAAAAGPPRISVWLGPGGTATVQPAADGAAAVSATLLPPGAPADRWSADGRAAELYGRLSGWHPDLLSVVQRVEQVGRWDLSERPAVEAWTGGRVVLIGDAAHPMLPHISRGVDQAVEDGAVLAQFLLRADALSAGRALSAFSRARAERVRRVQGLGFDTLPAAAPGTGLSPEERARRLCAIEEAAAEWIHPFDAAADAARRITALRAHR
ncbi:FAD-dependent monooxygenase [Nocardiopsis coralliicola]